MDWAQPPRLAETAIPKPGHGQILVKVANLCGFLPKDGELFTFQGGAIRDLREVIALSRPGSFTTKPSISRSAGWRKPMTGCITAHCAAGQS